MASKHRNMFYENKMEIASVRVSGFAGVVRKEVTPAKIPSNGSSGLRLTSPATWFGPQVKRSAQLPKSKGQRPHQSTDATIVVPPETSPELSATMIGNRRTPHLKRPQ
ncbi:hypothetical protein AAG570_005063 [Ranatra chinensis]|uniref:Uncharacterized protein n=1 Tax=Ranatra chinensis TaxID=642074 RepID=A0ABD0XZG3_9HEMI